MKRIAFTFLTLTAAFTPQMALAHPGHGQDSLVSGLLHPLMGVDHLVAMLLVGVGASIFMKHHSWMLPVSFLTALMIGFATFTWLPGSMAEIGILASLVALGVATALNFKTPAPLALMSIMVFGYVHGAAHGIETPVGATPALFAAGFLTASAALHLGGYALARALPVSAFRFVGAGSAGLGLAFAALH
jgi:urease accessory protein